MVTLVSRPIDRRAWPYVLRLYHGPAPCPLPGCVGKPGDLLQEILNKSRSGIQMDIGAARARMTRPDSDHVGRIEADGPDGPLDT